MFALPRSVQDEASPTDQPASQQLGGRSLDSRESLDRPVFSDHGAPDDGSSDGSVESGLRQETGTAHDSDKSPHVFDAGDGKRPRKGLNEDSEQSGDALDDWNEVEEMAVLASTYRDQGRWSDAERLQVQVVEAKKKKLGEEHSDTLASMSDLGSLYYEQGRREEAKKLLEQLVEPFRAKRGDHMLPGRRYVDGISILASIYSVQGRFEEAVKLAMEVMEFHKTAHWASYPSTIRSMADLASIYSSQGRLEEAETLQVEVLRANKEKLGERHPTTLASIKQLACTWNFQGRLDEAINLMRQCVQLREEVLGLDHADTRDSLRTLRGWLGEKQEVSGNDYV
jgi:tetratricopeptide (TPR) repeat protein